MPSPQFLRCLITLTFLPILTALPAQQLYEPGYLVEIGGKRTEVLILNRGWRYHPTEISVKTSADGPSAVRNTEGLEAFGIDGKVRYEQHEVSIEKSSSELSLLADTFPVPRRERVLLRVEVAGPASLYSYLAPRVAKYFLATGPSEPTQLIYSRTLRGGQVAENRGYRRQLSDALPCGDDFRISGGLGYTLRELTKVVREYNECTGTPYVVYDNRPSTDQAISLTFNAAAYRSDFQLWYVSEDVLISDMDDRWIPRLGLDVAYTLPFRGNKLALLFRPAYYTFASSGTYWFREREYDLSVDYTAVELPAAFRYYSFVNPAWQLFGTAGMGYTITRGRVERERDPAVSMQGMFLFTAEAGVRFRSHWTFSLGYLTHSSSLGNFAISSKAMGPYVQLGYTH